MSFNVSGLTSNVTSVGIQFQITHTYVGDLHATLSAPGGSPSILLFGDTGATGTADDNSNLNGQYGFFDTFSGDFWAAASTANGTDANLAVGGYRTSAEAANTTTSINTVMAGLTPGQANGTWQLSITDDCEVDVGAVTAATLFVDETPTLPVSLQQFKVD
ncbi:proprotein convertase P-domain-containing protein [Tahibacter amnicola]|uniref:Proprotein convertase P-domain-containing protein n=1 Tax=Tahibacter amnicola TaxID=2976241 RepID=A0ABY6BKG2_9GAMM|nr:proprotein convertase P-domain-containing protein [Tahibacter amnicola]UXI70504.1 proprotein convertase P-domain-containing protein [Tahibacter amnicola]